MAVPDYGDPTPAFEQIAADLRGQIKAGSISPGDRLPSTDALAAKYRVAKETIRKAVGVLRDEGIAEARSTKGTFVLREPAEPEPSAEFVLVMKRLDEMGEEVRQLRARLHDLDGQ